DRDGYLAILRPAGGAAPSRASLAALVQDRGHNARTLTELVTRFRHFRWQSSEQLATLGEDAWRRDATDLDGRGTTAADVVRAWVRDETQIIDTIARLAAGAA